MQTCWMSVALKFGEVSADVQFLTCRYDALGHKFSFGTFSRPGDRVDHTQPISWQMPANARSYQAIQSDRSSADTSVFHYLPLSSIIFHYLPLLFHYLPMYLYIDRYDIPFLHVSVYSFRYDIGTVFF